MNRTREVCFRPPSSSSSQSTDTNLDRTKPDQDRCRPWTSTDPDHITQPGEPEPGAQENQTRSALSSRSWTPDLRRTRSDFQVFVLLHLPGLVLTSSSILRVHMIMVQPQFPVVSHVIVATSVSSAFYYHGNITNDLSVKSLDQTRSLCGSGHVIMLPWRRPRTNRSAVIQGWCWRYFYLFIYLKWKIIFY